MTWATFGQIALLILWYRVSGWLLLGGMIGAGARVAKGEAVKWQARMTRK